MTKLLLLYGAGLGPWIWERTLSSVASPAVALQRNFRARTLEDCVTAVVKELDRAERTVIVGHSISAEVAMVAAARRPERTAGVIAVGGMVPESGKSFLSLLPFPQRLILRLLLRRSRNGITLPKSAVRAEYCNDLDGPTTELVLRNVTPEIARLYLDSAEWSSIPDRIPRYYVKLLDDRSVKPSKQDSIAARIGAARVVTMNTGHLPMLARPQEMAAVLDELLAEAATSAH